MLAIDSQIWIYYCDPNALEHDAIIKWMEPMLQAEDILLNAIIPVEIAHNLFTIKNKGKNLDANLVEESLIALISMKNCHFLEIDQDLVVNSISLIKKWRQVGIGGRDAIILASMDRFDVKTIITNDKNILGLNSLHRIDPVFDPPLELEIDEIFDANAFKIKIRDSFNREL